MPNKKIQPELASCVIFEGSKPTNAIKPQSHFANLANPVNSVVNITMKIKIPLTDLINNWKKMENLYRKYNDIQEEARKLEHPCKC